MVDIIISNPTSPSGIIVLIIKNAPKIEKTEPK